MSSYVANAALVASLLVAGASAQSNKGFTYVQGSRDPPGPDFWAAIPGSDCNGMSQSPIDVPPPPSYFASLMLRGNTADFEAPGTCPLDFPSPVFEPGCCTMDDVSYTVDGAEIKLSYPSAGCDLPAMTIAGERYSALQWHSHDRSEHTFAGKHRSGVLHIVHVQDSDPTKLAVLGVTYEADADVENATLAPYLARFQEVFDAQIAACEGGEPSPSGSPVAMASASPNAAASGAPSLASSGAPSLISSDEPSVPAFGEPSLPASDLPSTAPSEPGRRVEEAVVAGALEAERPVVQNLHYPRQLATGGDSPVANPYTLVPEGTNFFTYSGSLTTPPCSEIVTWFVLEDPLMISIKQFTTIEQMILNHVNDDCVLDTIASGAGDTFRPTQPLNGRKVRYCETA